MPGSSPELEPLPESLSRDSDVSQPASGGSATRSLVVPRSARALEDGILKMEEAVVRADLSGDRLGSAQARLALGRALLALEDAACREVLEDAGTSFEELGEAARVVEIDALLRRAAIAIEESPRSFHGMRRR